MGARMEKSAEAFRTISEVAEVLETPAHVLRFWESRFPQIRPVKRAGGRRYYRPADVALLTGIKHLLHDEGMTIRGVQKVLREQGVRHVISLSGDPDFTRDDEGTALEAALAAQFGADAAENVAPQEAESAQVVALETALMRATRAAAPSVDPVPAEPVAAEAGQPDFFSTRTSPTPVAATAANPVAEPPDPAPDARSDPTIAARLRALRRPITGDARARILPLRIRMAALQARLSRNPPPMR